MAERDAISLLEEALAIVLRARRYDIARQIDDVITALVVIKLNGDRK